MPEYRRQRYDELSDAEIQAAVARQWRCYYEAATDSDEQVAFYASLVDARAVCRDRGHDGWWIHAMGQARQEHRERVAASRVARERLLRGMMR